jgi:hypothetical protein
MALGPFAQQLATYKTRNVESGIGAAIPRAINYTGALMGNSSSSKYQYPYRYRVFPQDEKRFRTYGVLVLIPALCAHHLNFR